MEIEGKSALVTGGASGVGLCCVRQLLSCGAKNVAVCDYDDVHGAGVVKDLGLEFGPERVIFIQTDLNDTDKVEDAFKEAMSVFKRLDIVLCIGDAYSDLNSELELAISFYSTLRCTLFALQYMGKDKGGHGGVVCYTSSMLYMQPFANVPLYAATRQGGLDLCRSLGQPFHYGLTGVRVVTMCLGQPGKTLEQYSSLGLVDTASSPEMGVDFTLLSVQKFESVAEGMMTIVSEARSESVWVCDGDNPTYELTIPQEFQNND